LLQNQKGGPPLVETAACKKRPAALLHPVFFKRLRNNLRLLGSPPDLFHYGACPEEPDFDALQQDSCKQMNRPRASAPA